MNDDATPRILFVCMGNICRSPAGEGLFRAHLAERGLDGTIEVDSAGTISYHAGGPADPRMRRAAARRGVSLDSIARQVKREDLERFDLIIAMDRENLSDLRSLADQAGGGHDRLHLLTDFNAGEAVDVPDPYYGGERGFEIVLDMIEEACPRLLDHLLAGAGAAPGEAAMGGVANPGGGR